MDDVKTYITFNEYTTLNLGSLNESQFSGSIVLASMHFDILTGYTFMETGFDELPNHISYRLKLAVAMLVNHNHVKSKMTALAGELKSLSIGGTSQTMFTSSEVGVDKLPTYPQEVINLLRVMGYYKLKTVASVSTVDYPSRRRYTGCELYE